MIDMEHFSDEFDLSKPIDIKAGSLIEHIVYGSGEILEIFEHELECDVMFRCGTGRCSLEDLNKSWSLL